MPVPGDQDIVLYPHAADGIILVEDSGIDEACVSRILQVNVLDRVAREVDSGLDCYHPVFERTLISLGWLRRDERRFWSRYLG